MIKRLLLLPLIILLSLGLTQCAANFKETKAKIDTTQSDISHARDVANTEQPAVVTNDGYYTDTKPAHFEDEAAWLKRQVRLQASGMPLNMLMQQILRNTPASVTFQSGMDSSQTVSLNYSGTIKGALQRLASKTNLAVDVEGNQVNVMALITRTFNISFMPGSSNYMVGQNAGGSRGSSSASGSGDIVTVRGNLGNEQYSNLQASSLSVWNDLRSSLKELKSADGKVWVSESTTTVMVKDHPSNVAAIAKYINNLNKMMSEQVSIHVQVLELDLNKEHSFGIDFNQLLASIKKTEFLFGGAAGTAAIVGANTATGVNNALTSITVRDSSGDRGSAILNALSQQGDLRIVTEPTVVTMNNQVAEIRITRDTGYLQSISTTTSGFGTSETSLTPGVVTDGFALYLLPKIQNNRIFLQLSSSLSSLVNLQKVSNQPDNQQSSSDNDNGNNQQSFEAIQVPTIQEKHFNQRTVLVTGETLMISGFQQLRDELRKSGLLASKIPQGMGEQNRNVQTIVLLTPTIIRTH